jgi:hypothetical protein
LARLDAKPKINHVKLATNETTTTRAYVDIIGRNTTDDKLASRRLSKDNLDEKQKSNVKMNKGNFVVDL